MCCVYSVKRLLDVRQIRLYRSTHVPNVEALRCQRKHRTEHVNVNWAIESIERVAIYPNLHQIDPVTTAFIRFLVW